MNSEYRDKIIAARPTNIGRLIGGLVFVFIANLYKLDILMYISIIYIIIGLLWFFMVEVHYIFYANYPSLWYINSFIDIFTLSVFVYLTGTTHSFIIVGYIVITTLSSIDLNRKRGMFAANVSSLTYFMIVLLVYTDTLPYINILTNNTSEKVTILAVIISILLLTVANTVVNLVVFNIYNQLNETNLEVNMRYEEIKQLKFKQDGDYFLTSLLLEPLMEKIPSQGIIKIESYVSQFKKFSFKQEKREIGGDIVLQDEILLGNQEYKIIINADAMGKSIQGAGGALVFGVVMKTVISRTKGEIRFVTPDRWILETYYELQKIFESFDGLMLVSAILGLIDTSTGTFYFLNLEHPDIVLYKDAIASYIKPALNYPKIGMPYSKNPTSVDIFQLSEGDVLFLGSDGKDDLKSTSPETLDQYNHDENLFLSIVEAYKGNLSELVQNLNRYGTIIDDISLIKISYY